MNWKCLLVGLALVCPGTLLCVEGRYFSEESRAEAVDQQEGFLNRLFHQQQQSRRSQPEGYYNQRNEWFHAAHKKFTNTANSNSNNNQADNNVHQFQEPAVSAPANAGKIDSPDSPPSAKEPAAAAGAGGATKERGGQEVNQAVQPLALAQSAAVARANGMGSEGTQGVGAGNSLFILVVTGCTVLAAVGIIGAGVCWYKYHRSAKAASVVDYPAYGVTGPTKDRVPSPGDRKLAHSAQMYHYQHQKQQMMALQSASSGEMKHDGSDDESVEDNDDADYTVYECPGLAPTGEMEVKNPLFRGDDTPSTPANDDDSRPPPEY